MVTQVNARSGAWLDGVTVAANDLRLQLASAQLTATAASGSTGIAATQGVRPGQGSPLLSTWTSGMAFTLNAGTAYIVGTASGTAGVYTATLDTTTTLTVPNGDPTNPRIDSVIAVVSDVGTSASTDLFKILPGTPAGSPVHPTLPANAIRLCDIAVAANASVLSAGNFTDLRTYTVASGGILPVASTAGTQNGPAGAYEHDLTTGRLKVLNGSGAAQAPKVSAFAPVTSLFTANVSVPSGGGTQTITSLSVTTDGSTEVQFYAYVQGFQAVTPTVSAAINVYIAIDGVQFAGNSLTWVQENANNYEVGGGVILCFATPSAGTHTITLVGQQYGGGSTAINVIANTGANAGILRVQPVVN